MRSHLLTVTALLCLSHTAHSQAPTSSGEEIFETTCASCHVELADSKIPDLDQLRSMNGNAILRTLTDGAMRLQGDMLSAGQRLAVSEYLGGRIIEQPINFSRGLCENLPPVTRPAAEHIWSGWGNDEGNTRFVSETGGLDRSNVGQLKLKWAFGIPEVTSVRAQPAVYGDRLFIGSMSGAVFAINAESGCSYWSFETEGGVRSAISVAEIEHEGETRTAVFFNDQRAMAYAVDAETGEQIWATKVDDHPSAIATAALKYHDGRLYVPMSGLPEEAL
ncbi:MAG TPA: PQQ-binding-like beta-propeller repeat protein, partial [Pseudomonadaceae bacterium]|nr:PQQ-binding-like beta-propeller repeat protein [Pseudomonadaceae bacterium]